MSEMHIIRHTRTKSPEIYVCSTSITQNHLSANLIFAITQPSLQCVQSRRARDYVTKHSKQQISMVTHRYLQDSNEFGQCTWILKGVLQQVTTDEAFGSMEKYQQKQFFFFVFKFQQNITQNAKVTNYLMKNVHIW